MKNKYSKYRYREGEEISLIKNNHKQQNPRNDIFIQAAVCEGSTSDGRNGGIFTHNMLQALGYKSVYLTL